MQSKEFEQIQRGDRNRNRAARADRFWRTFLFTENGHVKSTFFLNTFCLSIVFIIVYGVVYFCLIDVLHTAMGPEMPVWGVNLVESLVPGVLGTAVCGLTLLLKNKRLMLGAFLWMIFLAALCLVTMLIFLWDDPVARGLFLRVFGMIVPAPLLMGSVLSGLVCYRRFKRTAPVELEPWKHQ